MRKSIPAIEPFPTRNLTSPGVTIPSAPSPARNALIDAAVEAEELFNLDDLERYAAHYRAANGIE